MPLILRAVKGSKLTIPEMDGNLTYLSSTLSGSIIQVTGSSISAPSTSITASSFVGSGSRIIGVISSSYAATSSYTATSSYSTTLGATLSNDSTGRLRLSNSAGNGISDVIKLTSSLALTSSYVNPLIQNVQITGSLTVTGSNTLIGNTILSGSVNVSGSTSFIGTHTLSGSNTITGNTVLNGSITVSGSSVFSNTIFIVTGSQFYTGSSVYIGNQTITGSLSLTSNGVGTGLYINGQKQFNYISAYHTASISATQNVSGSFIYSTVATSSGMSVVSGSRLTFANTGIYNIQFSVQVNTPTNNTNVYIWFKRNGVNIANSATQIDFGTTNYGVAAWNFADTFNSGSYAEIAYQSDQSTTQFLYAGATGNIPAIPSIIVTVTQVA